MKAEEKFVKDLVTDECETILLDVAVDYQAGEPPPDELWPGQLPVEILHFTVTHGTGVYYVPLRQVP